jgi:hypothetical protein
LTSDPTWHRTTGCRSLLLCLQQGGRVGSQRDCTWILGLPGFRVERVEWEESDATSRVRIRIQRCGSRAILTVAVASAPVACDRRGIADRCRLATHAVHRLLDISRLRSTALGCLEVGRARPPRALRFCASRGRTGLKPWAALMTCEPWPIAADGRLAIAHGETANHAPPSPCRTQPTRSSLARSPAGTSDRRASRQTLHRIRRGSSRPR